MEWAAFAAGKGTTPLVVDVDPFLARHLIARTLNVNPASGVFGAGGQPIAAMTLSGAGNSLTLTWAGAWVEPEVVIIVVGLKV